MNIKDIRNYILEDNFIITLTPQYVDIKSYKDIGTIDSKNITIYHEKGSIKITGNNMTVSKLLNKEILIVGDINNIELG